MSVKSTVELTREEAEALYIRMMSRRIGAVPVNNSALEVELMMMDDEDHGGESFHNYRIVADKGRGK